MVWNGSFSPKKDVDGKRERHRSGRRAPAGGLGQTRTSHVYPGRKTNEPGEKDTGRYPVDPSNACDRNGLRAFDQDGSEHLLFNRKILQERVRSTLSLSKPRPTVGRFLHPSTTTRRENASPRSISKSQVGASLEKGEFYEKEAKGSGRSQLLDCFVGIDMATYSSHTSPLNG